MRRVGDVTPTYDYDSTVIVLLPAWIAELDADLGAETPVKLGQRLATP